MLANSPLATQRIYMSEFSVFKITVLCVAAVSCYDYITVIVVSPHSFGQHSTALTYITVNMDKCDNTPGEAPSIGYWPRHIQVKSMHLLRMTITRGWQKESNKLY
uniref:Uncharacterized protein n=2 Tax=Anguilla anguilla TaxID=7936 RepID=A0A0E9XI50_ANGAN